MAGSSFPIPYIFCYLNLYLGLVCSGFFIEDKDSSSKLWVSELKYSII